MLWNTANKELAVTTNNPDKEDRQNKGLDHDASRHGGDEPRRQAAPDADDPRNGVPSVGRGLDEERDSTSDQEKFGSGTPGDQGTYSVVGAQPDGGAGGLGSQVQSGDGSPRDIAEAYRAGANSYLVKPTNLSTLTELAIGLRSYWLRLNVPPNEPVTN